MTIGKKIKYIRKLYRMTSAELAEKSGIHPVSIRKYESDKMVPQQAQIDRIAAAFNLSPIVFSGVSDMSFDFNYTGDLLALLVMLYTSGGLMVNGERKNDGGLIPDTVKLSINPVFSKYFNFKTAQGETNPQDLSLDIIDEDMLKGFVYWEYMYNRKNALFDAYEEDETDENLAAYEEALNAFEEAEMYVLLYGRLGNALEKMI